jgi:hypothetical protein
MRVRQAAIRAVLAGAPCWFLAWLTLQASIDGGGTFRRNVHRTIRGYIQEVITLCSHLCVKRIQNNHIFVLVLCTLPGLWPEC